MKLKNILIAVTLILSGALAMRLAAPPVADAQTVTPTFSVAGVAGGNGVAIVDQTTGDITFCTSYVIVGINSATPGSGSCKSMGNAKPGVGSSSLSLAGGTSAFWVVNNQTGAILECASIAFIGVGQSTPEGTCRAFGSALK